MPFENALILSEVLHYVFILGMVLLFLLKRFKDFIKLVLTSYVLFLVWGVTCYLFQGCPLTLFENWLSTRVYGKPFYPHYTFTNSDFYYLVTNIDFYIPAVLLLIVVGSKKYANGKEE